MKYAAQVSGPSFGRAGGRLKGGSCAAAMGASNLRPALREWTRKAAKFSSSFSDSILEDEAKTRSIPIKNRAGSWTFRNCIEGEFTIAICCFRIQVHRDCNTWKNHEVCFHFPMWNAISVLFYSVYFCPCPEEDGRSCCHLIKVYFTCLETCEDFTGDLGGCKKSGNFLCLPFSTV